MSRVTELAEAEARAAEQAESEPRGAGDDGAGEPEPAEQPLPLEPPEPPAPFDPKRLERELGRHEREMAKVLGDSWADMAPCDTCGGAGFMPADARPDPPVEFDPDCVVCEACHGWGSRRTGSLAEGQEVITCGVCNGAGWRDRKAIEAAEQLAAVSVPQTATPGPAPQPVWNPLAQRWELATGEVGHNSPAGIPLAPVT